jgi:hypothetical protein
MLFTSPHRYYIHSFTGIRSFIRPFILFIIHPYLRSHGRLFLGSPPDYGMVSNCHGPSLISLVQ